MPRVGDHTTRAVPTVRASDTVDTVLRDLAGQQFDSVNSVFILDKNERLLGQIELTTLLAMSPSALAIGEMPRSIVLTVDQDADREVAASMAIRETVASIAVTDESGRFIGAFAPKEIMTVLRSEHVQDLHRISGIWHSNQYAVQAIEERPVLRLRHRLPWLLIGLFGSVIATKVVAQFEVILEANVVLAFFIPMIVYLADAVGTQTEAIAVRGLSLSTSGLRKLLLGEVITGSFIGLTLAAFAAVFAVVLYGMPELAVILAISVFCACALATFIGLLLPWSFNRIGWDPALSSGPIATVIQDVLSLLIFLAVASLLLA